MSPRPPARKHKSSAPAMLALLVLLLPVFSCNRGSSSKENLGAGETQQLRRKLAELNRREQILTAEYSLARNPAPYIVIDLHSGNIAMRARGRELRTFGVADVREQKREISADPVWNMIEKKPLEQSERPQITPGAGEQATAEAAKQSLWGLHRMPSDYDLICEGDRVLEIRALPSSESGPRVWQWAKTAYRRSIDQYRTWRTAKTDKAHDRIQLWLPEEDSRLLFWSLPKKLNLLVLD